MGFVVFLEGRGILVAHDSFVHVYEIIYVLINENNQTWIIYLQNLVGNPKKVRCGNNFTSAAKLLDTKKVFSILSFLQKKYSFWRL